MEALYVVVLIFACAYIAASQFLVRRHLRIEVGITRSELETIVDRVFGTGWNRVRGPGDINVAYVTQRHPFTISIEAGDAATNPTRSVHIWLSAASKQTSTWSSGLIRRAPLILFKQMMLVRQLRTASVGASPTIPVAGDQREPVDHVFETEPNRSGVTSSPEHETAAPGSVPVEAPVDPSSIGAGQPTSQHSNLSPSLELSDGILCEVGVVLDDASSERFGVTGAMLAVTSNFAIIYSTGKGLRETMQRIGDVKVHVAFARTAAYVEHVRQAARQGDGQAANFLAVGIPALASYTPGGISKGTRRERKVGVLRKSGCLTSEIVAKEYERHTVLPKHVDDGSIQITVVMIGTSETVAAIESTLQSSAGELHRYALPDG